MFANGICAKKSRHKIEIEPRFLSQKVLPERNGTLSSASKNFVILVKYIQIIVIREGDHGANLSLFLISRLTSNRNLSKFDLVPAVERLFCSFIRLHHSSLRVRLLLHIKNSLNIIIKKKVKGKEKQ